MAASDKWLTIGDDGVARCWWCGADGLYVAYHDSEWGRPVADDRRLFEKICLEGFQCGLSWLTILRKRDRFREVFFDFDIESVAAMTQRDVRRLLGDAGIIRHRGKIEAAIKNAHAALRCAEESGSLAAYLWRFAPRSGAAARKRGDQVPATTDASTVLSKDLRRRGWSFVGPTTVYAFMQSVGMVNDHLTGCRAQAAVEEARRRFDPPAGPADSPRSATR